MGDDSSASPREPASEPAVESAFAPAIERAGFGATLVAVLWSFFGVRKRRDLERDAARLNPVAVVVAALVATAAFVGVLLLVVRSVVK